MDHETKRVTALAEQRLERLMKADQKMEASIAMERKFQVERETERSRKEHEKFLNDKVQFKTVNAQLLDEKRRREEKDREAEAKFAREYKAANDRALKEESCRFETRRKEALDYRARSLADQQEELKKKRESAADPLKVERELRRQQEMEKLAINQLLLRDHEEAVLSEEKRLRENLKFAAVKQPAACERTSSLPPTVCADLSSFRKRGIVSVIGSPKDEHAVFSEALGRSIALGGYSLMTGGGSTGVMKSVCRGFSSVPQAERKGRNIAILWGGSSGYKLPGYPNEYIEVVSYLKTVDVKVGVHMVTSRNHMNEADVVIALPGGAETRSEIQTALGYEHPTIVDKFWIDTFPAMWEYQDVEDCLAIINAVVRDKKERPEVYKLKVANCLDGKSAAWLREQESMRVIEKAKDNERWAKEQERLER